MTYHMTLSTEAAFARYEEVRARLPAAAFPATSVPRATLAEVAPEVDAFVLDAFGVLNVGQTAIPGAVARIAQLRAMGKTLIVLTNAASDTRAAALRK
ncbi:MAG: TIGR01459 family HAD-type hydrolase, partial [Pseudomonadota bacterium]